MCTVRFSVTVSQPAGTTQRQNLVASLLKSEKTFTAFAYREKVESSIKVSPSRKNRTVIYLNSIDVYIEFLYFFFFPLSFVST